MKQKVTARPVSEASQGVRDPTDVTVRGLLARSMSTRRFRVTLLAGSLLSVFGAAILGAWLDAREHARFEAQADATLAQVERGFVAPLEALHAIAAFHDASPDADVASFARFAHPLLARHKSLAALEWALVVTDAGRDALEARLSQGRAIPFSIREPDAKGDLLPSPRRDLYAPLLRLEPALPTLEGLNVAFDTPRRRLFDETVRRRAMTVSTKFRLVEDPEGVFSVAVMEPIYESPTDRLPRALGIALYRLEPLVRAATEGAHLEGMWLALFDEDETLRADERVLFATGGEPASGRTMNRRLDFGGKHCARRW